MAVVGDQTYTQIAVRLEMLLGMVKSRIRWSRIKLIRLRPARCALPSTSRQFGVATAD